MNFLPIVERELRVASRRRSTYWVRVSGALTAIAISGWIGIGVGGNPQGLGQALFIVLSVLIFIYALGTGARVTSDALSEEKREGTLGLLFLTDLRGYDIVFGKLAATSLNAFYGMLAAFPVIAIPLLLGGVTYAEFWRVMLVAVNLLFFSLAVGMFSSSVCRDERKSMSLTVLLILFLCATVPAIELYSHRGSSRLFDFTYLLPSPAYGCFLAFDGFYRTSKPNHFWINLGIAHLYGWSLLGLASLIVPRTWQDKPQGPRATVLKRKLQALKQGKPAAQLAFRTRLLDKNPFLWLAARDRFKATAVWLLLLAAGACWFWGYAKTGSDWLDSGIYVLTASALHTMIKYWVASESCKRFIEDRRSGALELLLSTPLSVGEILRGQRMALFHQFGRPALFILGVDFLLMGLGVFEASRSEDRTFWVLLFLGGMGIFALDLVALSWTGMWMGMTQTRTNQATTATITRILVLPWVCFGLITTLLGMLALLGRLSWIRQFRLEETHILALWLIIAVLFDWFFIRTSKRKLHERFRELATHRSSPAYEFPLTKFFGKKPSAPPVISS